MIKIIIFGTGNVATHFIKAFQKTTDIKVIQIYNHDSLSLKPFEDISTTTNFNTIQNADLYLICVNDDNVYQIAKKIASPNALVAHTSGSLPLLDLPCRNAVFYPLQTFSKDKNISFKDVPICIDCQQQKDFDLLQDIANAIQAKHYRINTKQRQELHLAAVFVCNFVNHLYYIGHQICVKNKIQFDLLIPLIKETAEKIKQKIPKNTQTGPAVRKDQSTIKRHLQQMDNDNFKNIYNQLTSSIISTYE